MAHLFLVKNNRPQIEAPSTVNSLCPRFSPSDVVLECESREEFSELLNTYLNRFQPTNVVEQKFVEDMVMARWRHRRYWLIEGALLDLAMQTQIDVGDKKTALPEVTLKLAAKIQNSCRRRHQKALEMLLELRANRWLDRRSAS